MLILFDIDATLITTCRSGVVAMEIAGRELFGPGFTAEKTAFAGRLDPLIIADLLRDNGKEVSVANLEAMRRGYRRHLEHRLEDRSLARPLPGVVPLLNALEERGDAVLGLLTGNYQDTGEIKLRACGIDPKRFTIQVWGDHSPHIPPCRTHLPPIGMERYRAAHGPLESDRVTIIGDTPHDVACAKAHGCRSLGVATGSFSFEDLQQAGASHVVSDLSQTAPIVEWLLDSGGNGVGRHE